MTRARPAYREWAAGSALSADVACLWTSQLHQLTPPLDDRVLPDACIDIVWDGQDLFVAGPDTGPVLISWRPRGFFVGIRFRPGRARQFLSVPASELLDQRVPLEDVLGSAPAARIAERLSAAQVPDAAARVLEAEVLGVRSANRQPDPLVDAVVGELRAPDGAAGMRPVTVAALSLRLGLSERELLRRCRAGVGYGPKTLDRILRFQRARKLAARMGGVAATAAEAGYSDQAHLTRECRRLSGLTPSDLFKTWATPPR